MATIKIKWRASSIEGKAGTVYYQITHRRVIRHITTDIHILPEYWDAEQQRVIVASKHDMAISQIRIDGDMFFVAFHYQYF